MSRREEVGKINSVLGEFRLNFNVWHREVGFEGSCLQVGIMH